MSHPSLPVQQGLYDPRFERDACGVGFVAQIKGIKSHHIVLQGLQILKNLTHRGAVGADPLAGDGAGILIQIPDAFLRKSCAAIGIDLPAVGDYGVGMVFLPRDAAARAACEGVIAAKIAAEGQTLLGWRDVPVDNSGLGESVKAVEPLVRQVFIGRGSNCAAKFPDIDSFERKLFVIRKTTEHAVRNLPDGQGLSFYIPSLSTRTIVYKGMLLADQVGSYYLDLQDESAVSALALVHQRFSTNTFPTWDLAHPFRMIAHNGEINTLRGNMNWMTARQAAMSSDLLGEDLEKLWPLIVEGQSDSACLDNALELLVAGGYSLPHAMMLLIPEVWEDNPLLTEERHAFFEYHSALMEPWDGPAAVAFTDGRQIGVTLDRNGLRPARYLITDDDVVLMASEMGVLDIPQHKIVKKWRIQPGKMFLIDLEAGQLVDVIEMKQQLSCAKPYQQWIEQSRYVLGDLPGATADAQRPESLLDTQQAFGYTQEDLKFILKPMADTGKEAIGSMGTDAALPVLSDKNRGLYDYFQQLFAQVTNPPIDPIREELVMSLTTFIGPKPNLLGINAAAPAPRLEVHQPVLSNEDLAKLRNIDALTQGRFKSCVLDITYPATAGAAGCAGAIEALRAQAGQAIAEGCNVLILSDRAVSAERIAIPALLACSGLHHHLVRTGLRTRTGLVVDTGSAREVHHFALLAGYGAEAVCPWLALETLDAMKLPLAKEAAHKHFIKAIGKGLYKVMSKMGISTYQSYCGAQIFEAVGLNSAFIDQYFTGTATQIEGVGLPEIAEEAARTHRLAYGSDPVLLDALDAGGEYAWRTRGEAHMWTPETIAKLQHATRANNAQSYKDYARLINDQSRQMKTLRGLFEIKPAGAPVPLEEVETAKEIVKRFVTGAMSLGSISTEAHTTLAIAMNRIGGKSNTGEGGEDAGRYRQIKGGDTLSAIIGKGRIERDLVLQDGDSLRSRIKQVASGRFGVTAEYLSSADQIQIKMAQGAKPGEGGQLPGHKVSEYIAHLRFSVPGVGLISPPPHHDIYSIEDLAQLIHDLKNANPKASISVKLVSEIGVGTVAAGVSKAKADHIVVAGFDGGTGASPLSSIKHGGTPWELGLAETQQTLVLNRLRGRVALQVDGQLKTGRDVLIGALLGADEFGFATAPLVVEGCIMMRKCHLNTCPVGVATQDPELRKKFTGQPEHVVNYFFFLAEEVRELMAQIGIRKFDDLIGRSDLLDMRQGVAHWKAKGLDFGKIFHQPDMPASVARLHNETQDHGLEHALDHQLIAQAKSALDSKQPVVLNSAIRNVNRTVGTMLSHEVAKRYGRDGLPDDTITVKFAGTAGQSFGAFLSNGISFELSGEGNDYVGKGLCGGRIAVMPPADCPIVAENNIIVGNTVLYGATSGECYFSGVAGERFAVRNSGATAVVEGIGDHGCEYMTGGMVVVLGQTGRNFAAGMSGGIAYVLDENDGFEQRCNRSMVELEQIPKVSIDSDNGKEDDPASVHLNHLGKADEIVLRNTIENHLRYTGSVRAKLILDNWAKYLPLFVKVMPTEYRRALQELAAQRMKHGDCSNG